MRVKYSEEVRRKATILFFVEITLSLLLVVTIILVAFVNTGSRFLFYSFLVFALELMLFLSIYYLLFGHYTRASRVMVLAIIIGPWVSFFFDPVIAGGDFVPLIYITLVIQLGSIFLSERMTVLVAAMQFLFLCLFVLSHPALLKINLPSLFSYLFFASAVGIVTSFVTRRQMEQIGRQYKKLEENERRLNEISLRDSMTGLYNRRYMDQFLNRTMQNAIKENHHFGILISDVDGFKSINDTYGHLYGDAVLVKVSEVFLAKSGKEGAACRYGGDEFVLILTGLSVAEIKKTAEDIHQQIKETDFTFEGMKATVTLSIGVAFFPNQGKTGEAILKAADKALYAAKNQGRNRVVMSTELKG